MHSHPNDPLHGLTLEKVLRSIVARHGWSHEQLPENQRQGKNNFQERRGDAVHIENCEDVLVNGNEFRGLNSKAYAAVRVNKTDGFNISGNVFRSFQFGVAVQGSENGLITSNLIRDVQKGLDGIDPSKVEEFANKIIPTTK